MLQDGFFLLLIPTMYDCHPNSSSFLHYASSRPVRHVVSSSTHRASHPKLAETAQRAHYVVISQTGYPRLPTFSKPT